MKKLTPETAAQLQAHADLSGMTADQFTGKEHTPGDLYLNSFACR